MHGARQLRDTMKLPNGESAYVDLLKLLEYCLSPDHPRGRHKAFVFGSVLGVTSEDAEELRDALLDAAHSGTAQFLSEDIYGERYVVDFPLRGPKGSATVRSIWILRTGEDFPRLVTCYVR